MSPETQWTVSMDAWRVQTYSLEFSFLSHQSRRPSDSEEHVGFEGVGDQWRSVDQVDSRDSLHATSSHNRLFTVQAVISELKRKSGENYETPKETFLFSRKFDEKHETKLRNIEDDIFVEDIELVNIFKEV